MLGITIAIVVFIGVVLIIAYNQLVGMRNRIKESFAAIEVYLQNRFDALTKVAEVVISYAAHERETLLEVTKMREGISDRQSSEERLHTYAEMDKKLTSINLQAEAYPELKASENYIQLQRTINDLEEKLSASRRTYNGNVTTYNTKIASIPMNLVAGLLGFRSQMLLEVEEAKKADVNMKELLRG
jgi:LemA protein